MKSCFVLVVPALVIVASTASAQETFSPSNGGDDAVSSPPATTPPATPPPATPPPAAAAPSAPSGADEWWRAKPRPLRPPKPLALRLDGGYAPRRLFGLGVSGADLGLGLGVQTTHRTAWWATSRVSIGSTENGLSVWSARFGAEVEAVFDPVRLGFGAGLIFLGVDRAERDQTLISYGFEARGFGRVDVTRNDDYALFLRAGIDAGAEARGGSVFWGPTFGVGVELGVRGKRPEAWTATASSPSRM